MTEGEDGGRSKAGGNTQPLVPGRRIDPFPGLYSLSASEPI